MRRLVLLLLLVLLCMVAACGGDDTPDPIADSGADSTLPMACRNHEECGDGLYCNGNEVCDATRDDADPITHCAPGIAVVCDDGISCTTDRCDESADACAASPLDVDEDGHPNASCVDDSGESLGDDCDDEDATRFVGNTERCEPGDDNATRDEDCDATTFGTRDEDGDGHVDEACCNDDAQGEPQCGGDCNDSDVNTYEGAGELCDGIDNDCDGEMDESPVIADWYPDRDGDGFGDPNGPVTESCAPVDDYALRGTDCNDDDSTMNPGNTEACDGIDNNCNGMTDEGLSACNLDCNPACGQHAHCDDSSMCVCNDGYSGDGQTCADINECMQSNGGCDSDPNACINMPGSFRCDCPNGYVGTGIGENSCLEFNECINDADNCDSAPEACVNAIGSFSCVCPSGYVGDGIGTNGCTDELTCAVNNGGCDTHANCSEVIGSANTCACQTGYVGNGVTCTDVNDCLTNNGGCGNATFYACANQPGPTPICTDINECATDNGGCDALSPCTNNDGAVASCGACPSGYTGSGDTACTPTLLTLTVSAGTLTPTFDPLVTSYAVGLPITTQTIGVTTTVPNGATVTINNQAVVGGMWESPALNLGGNTLSIVVSQAGQPSRTYTINIGRGAYFKSSAGGIGDMFGSVVALSGDTLVVGVPEEDSNATGINGNASNNSVDEAGAVYVFVRQNGNWSQQAYLKASNTDEGDNFGTTVAIEGDTIVVGAPGEDSVATGINGDANSDAANNAGAAYIFVRNGSTWTQQAYLKASNTSMGSRFGSAVAISGNSVVVGAPTEAMSGATYVFVGNGSTWTQQALLRSSNIEVDDGFGEAVDIDSDTILVGAPREDSNATTVGGNQADNNRLNSGAAYVFIRSMTTWSQQAYLKPINAGAGDVFGASVALSGNTTVVGAPYEDSRGTGVNSATTNDGGNNNGAAYVFVRNVSTWTQQAYVKASTAHNQDLFGTAVALDGERLLIGAPEEGSGATGFDGSQTYSATYDSSGAAYLFERSGVTWAQTRFVKATNTDADDNFGASVAVTQSTIAIGAPYENSNATGVNSDQANNTLNNNGAAYVYP